MNAAPGPRLVVTRPSAQAEGAVRQLRARGIDAVALPLIEIATVDDAAPLVAAWRRLAAYRLVVFVSANAVLHFFAARPGGGAWPEGSFAAAPGPGTAAALRAGGVDAAAVIEPAEDAAQLDSESLWQRLQGLEWRGARVLVVRGDGGRDWLAQQLEAAGASVDTVTAYARHAPTLDEEGRATLAEALRDAAAHAWLFSSSEAIGHLEALACDVRWADAVAVATHPRIAARARQAGFGTVHEVRADLDDVVACIQSMRP